MDVYLSMLSGFAPLAGFFLLLGVLTALYVLLLSEAERILTEEQETPVPEPDPKLKRHTISRSALPLLLDYLSLQEHSPPLSRLS